MALVVTYTPVDSHAVKNTEAEQIVHGKLGFCFALFYLKDTELGE